MNRSPPLLPSGPLSSTTSISFAWPAAPRRPSCRSPHTRGGGALWSPSSQCTCPVACIPAPGRTAWSLAYRLQAGQHGDLLGRVRVAGCHGPGSAEGAIEGGRFAVKGGRAEGTAATGTGTGDGGERRGGGGRAPQADKPHGPTTAAGALLSAPLCSSPSSIFSRSGSNVVE